ALGDALERITGAYNDAMAVLNRAVHPQTGLLADSDQANRTRIHLRNAGADAVDGQPDGWTYAEQAGVLPEPGIQAAFHAAQLDTMLVELRDTLGGFRDAMRPLERQTGAPSVVNALDHLGITADDNDTLRLDRERLAEALEQDFAPVRDLFAKEPDGWAARLAGTVDDAVRPGSGMLALGRQRLEALVGGRHTREIEDALEASTGLNALRTLQALQAAAL
ncbi:MAG: flagellar filament capping protein FliD, partial [Planctomycetota bacterium]